MANAPTIPILDGHNDTLLRLLRVEREQGGGFLDGGGAGHVDLPRARAGGLAGGFFAVFVPPGSAADDAVRVGAPDLDVTITDVGYEVRPAPPIDPAYARRATLAMVARLFRLEEQSSGRVRVVRTVNELTSAMDGGVLAAILHLVVRHP